MSRAWPAALLALAGCSKVAALGRIGLRTVAETKAAAKHAATEVHEEPSEAAPPFSPAPFAPPQPAPPAPRPPVAQAPVPPLPRPSPLPSCGDLERCNTLELQGAPVTVDQKGWGWLAPKPKGGAIAGGVYDLTAADVYPGVLGSRSSRAGSTKLSTIALPPFAAHEGQIVAQEVEAVGGCADSSTLAVDVADGKLTTAPICTSTPCHGCGGSLGYTSQGDTLQLIYPTGEVDTFTRRAAP